MIYRVELTANAAMVFHTLPSDVQDGVADQIYHRAVHRLTQDAPNAIPVKTHEDHQEHSSYGSAASSLTEVLSGVLQELADEAAPSVYLADRPQERIEAYHATAVGHELDRRW